MSGNIYIVLVNWNGCEDTLECLESVFRLQYPNFKVVVCDNASSDHSLEKIKRWAEGRLEAPATSSELARLMSPRIDKPVGYVEYDRQQAERGLNDGDDCRLVLIQTGGNLGFAGGNNVGIRYALAQGADYVWLLNNDTVVEPGALDALVARAEADRDIGIVGSTLRFYGEPDKLQAQGGATFVPWRCSARPIGIGLPYGEVSESMQREIEQKTAYVIGASMLVSRCFLESIGLLSEDYFLYYEELDWACRAAGKFRLGYAPNSHVYHKVGVAAGNGSLFSLGFMYRSRLRFMKKFFPQLLSLTRFWMLVEGAKAMLKGRLGEARLAGSVALSLAQHSTKP